MYQDGCGKGRRELSASPKLKNKSDKCGKRIKVKNPVKCAILLLSATPFLRHSADIYALLALLDGSAYKEDIKFAFSELHRRTDVLPENLMLLVDKRTVTMKPVAKPQPLTFSFKTGTLTKPEQTVMNDVDATFKSKQQYMNYMLRNPHATPQEKQNAVNNFMTCLTRGTIW